MIEIPTSRGLPILADETDADLLYRFRWYAVQVASGRFYAQARVPGTGSAHERVSMHRLLLGPPKGMVVHHINGNGLDNRRCNLQITTQSRNIAHAYHARQTGVFREGAKFRGETRIDGTKFYVGTFEDEDTAYRAVDMARDKLVGLSPTEAQHMLKRIRYHAKMSGEAMPDPPTLPVSVHGAGG